MKIKKNAPFYPTIQSLSQFIEQIIEVLDKQILSFSEKKMANLLVEIHTFAKNKVDELYIITRLLIHANERKTYYYNKRHQSYNYDALKYAILWLCALAILGLLFYFILIWYHFPKEKELADLTKKLETFGITVTNCSKKSYRHTSYYLEVSASRDLSQYQYSIAKNLFKQACKVHGDIYGWIKWSLIITGSFILMAIRELFSRIRSWLRQRYKQRFEAWSFIEQKLRQVEDSWIEY